MQTTVLTDETQTCTVTVTEGYPVLYSNNRTLRQALLKIGDLHTAEPINTILFEPGGVAPVTHQLTVTLNDARVALFNFTSVDPSYSAYTITFTGGTWEETSLDLLIILKNAILKLNDEFVLETGDSFSWESI